MEPSSDGFHSSCIACLPVDFPAQRLFSRQAFCQPSRMHRKSSAAACSSRPVEKSFHASGFKGLGSFGS
eukprot:1586168-Amphidinium_carterae.1